MRKAGIVTPITVSDGTVYNSPGQGYATSGMSLRTMRWVTEIRQRLRQFQKLTRDSPELFAGELLGQHDTIRLRLSIDEHYDAFAVHAQSAIRFRLGPLFQSR